MKTRESFFKEHYQRNEIDLYDIGEISLIDCKRSPYCSGIVFTTVDGNVLQETGGKPQFRLLGYSQIWDDTNNKSYYCTDPRVLRFCTIWLWMRFNKKIRKYVEKNFCDEDLFTVIDRLFVREANKDRTSYEEAQQWLDKNLIKLDPEMTLIQEERRQKYLYDFGLLIEEPQGWNFEL